MDRVRVLRLLEYEGPRDWVEATLAQNAVKGTKDLGNGCVIREGMIGDFPVVVEEIKKEYILTEKETKFMERFGWDFPQHSGGAKKHDITTGKVLAHEGDETWDWDLKAAGE